jgi:hypothetical protein
MIRGLERKVEELGGVQVLIERIANGETILALATEMGFSRDLLSVFLNRDETQEAVRSARARSAAAMAEKALEIADTNTPEQAPKTRWQVETRRWLASKYDPETFAEKPSVAINVTIGGLHMESLRRRPVQALPDPQVIDIEPLMD